MNSQSNSLNNSYGSAGNTHDHLSKEFGLGGLSQLSLADDLLSLNDSIWLPLTIISPELTESSPPKRFKRVDNWLEVYDYIKEKYNGGKSSN